MSDRVDISGLSVDSGLYQLVEEIAAGSGVEVENFWQSLAGILDELGTQNRELLDKRDRLQAEIDAWHKANPGEIDRDRYKAFLQEIGYLVPEPEPFQVSTANVDDEIAVIAGPQLVVPVDNARYALNAANARWYSLYDALYGTDIILEVQGCKKTAKYNPVRGQQVIRYVREFLDQAVPLAVGSHAYAVRYKVVVRQAGGGHGRRQPRRLGWRECFVGYTGDPDKPRIGFDEAQQPAHRIEDRRGLLHRPGRPGEYLRRQWLESAITTIMDCEDSVSAVDAEDKVRVYRNWLGLMKGDLNATGGARQGNHRAHPEPRSRNTPRRTVRASACRGAA